MSDETENSGIPDAVLAVLTQLVFGVSLATSAVPPSVLSFQDRASETLGVFLVLICTGALAFPLRSLLGKQDITGSEYILAVLAPIATRLDLGLLIWVNVNKAFLWATQILYASEEEWYCVQLLILASSVWHNGDNRITDPEFGFYGGDAAMLMYKIQKDYHPKNASGNALAWIGHITLYPFALIFHFVLQIISKSGLVVLVTLYNVFGILLPGRGPSGKRRGSMKDMLLVKKLVHSRKLFMRGVVASVFDTHQAVITHDRRKVRQKWAFLGNIDAISKHEHFKKLFNISYPMRAPRVLQRVSKDPVNRDVFKVLNKEYVMFSDFSDEPLIGIGETASRQVMTYAVLRWHFYPGYSDKCFENVKRFSEGNMEAWKRTESRLSSNGSMLSEFISIRDIMRRALVQLIMLAWWDGLGECQSDETVSDVAEDLTKNYLLGPIRGIEMAVRLSQLPSTWNDAAQTSKMITSLGKIMQACNCTLCQEMDIHRRLTEVRYQSRLPLPEMEQQLQSEGCLKATEITQVWKNAVKSWISEIFEIYVD